MQWPQPFDFGLCLGGLKTYEEKTLGAPKAQGVRVGGHETRKSDEFDSKGFCLLWPPASQPHPALAIRAFRALWCQFVYDSCDSLWVVKADFFSCEFGT